MVSACAEPEAGGQEDFIFCFLFCGFADGGGDEGIGEEGEKWTVLFKRAGGDDDNGVSAEGIDFLPGHFCEDHAVIVNDFWTFLSVVFGQTDSAFSSQVKTVYVYD